MKIRKALAIMIICLAGINLTGYKFFSSEDLNPIMEDYLDDLDQEERQQLIDEAVSMQYPVNWSMLWIVVKRIDADGEDRNGKKAHIDVEMSDEEAEYLLYDMPERFSKRVKEYTDGLVNVRITPLLYDEVNYLDKDAYWDLVPESFEDIKDSFSKYNSVMVTERLSEVGKERVLAQDWTGMGYTRNFPGNYSFSQVATGDQMAYEDGSYLAVFDGNPVPEEVYIHEWLHTFEDFEELMLDCDGNPDDAEKHGYECRTTFGANGFYEYYEDLLNREVWDDEKKTYVGMGEDLWRTSAWLKDESKGRN